MVWLCRDNNDKEYAVKQIAKKKMDNNYGIYHCRVRNLFCGFCPQI